MCKVKYQILRLHNTMFQCRFDKNIALHAIVSFQWILPLISLQGILTIWNIQSRLSMHITLTMAITVLAV